MKEKLTLGILAHVDAGKTTLSEALLYTCGVRRTLGRVDHRNAFLDTHNLERERGITIFSKQALLDTAMDCAQHHVGSFLSLAQLMAGLTEEIPMADTYWELAEEAQLEPVTNVGTIAFRLTGGPIGHLNIRVEEQRALGGSLMLTMLYDGTRHPVRREQELRAICAWLATALSDERYGGVVLGNPSPFKVGDVVGLKVPVGDIRVQQGVWTGTVPAEPATPPAAPSTRINPTGSMGESPVS